MFKTTRYARYMPIAICSALLLGTAQFASAQKSVSSSAFGRADIVAGLTITKSHDLLFGQIVADSVGGIVTIGTTGARSTTGPALIAQSGVQYSTFHQASFAITGTAGFVYTIGLPSLPVTLTGSGTGSPTMTIQDFTSSPETTGTLDLTGASTLNVGAALTVGVNQAAGGYSGSFNVTVAYQ